MNSGVGVCVENQNQWVYLRPWDQHWVKCSKLRLMISLEPEVLCLWSFPKVPRYPATNCFHSSPLLSAVRHNWRTDGWVCKDICYFHFSYLNSIYKLQSSVVQKAWFLAMETWHWSILRQLTTGLCSSHVYRWHFNHIAYTFLHCHHHSDRKELHLLHFSEGERQQWPAKYRVSENSI